MLDVYSKFYKEPLPISDKGDPEFRSFIYELVEEIQDLCPYSPQAQILRKLVAHFGEAYFFYTKAGQLCFMTDFLTEIR